MASSQQEIVIEAGGTAVLMLSAVPFVNLGLPELPGEPAPSLAETVQHGIYQGAIAPIALYGALVAVVWRNRRTAAKSEEEER